MKKIIAVLLFMFISLETSAMNPADSLNKLDDNFKPECYENYNKIDKSEVWNNLTNEKYKTYKIDINKTTDLLVVQNGFILPYKFYSSNDNRYNYSNSLGINNKYLLDYNRNTYKEINSKTQSEFILSFDETLEKNNFSFIFDYRSDNLIAEYYISLDEKNWDLIKKYNLNDFSFNYLKIKFTNKDLLSSKIYIENIDIYELNFPKKSNIILVQSMYNENIELYSKYNCKNKDLNTKAINSDNFSIDSNTKTINISSGKNPKYNVYSKKDYDNDWIEDEVDNCKYRYNPDQSDMNGDGRGDICSDDDNDGRIGYYDNCIYISNPDQKDINVNGIGDVCEFDKDEDGIYDSIDNCIGVSNPDQKDTDKDNIGDVCDNCRLYNPSQLDKDNNSFGDRCDQENQYILVNDIDGDKIINSKDNCKEISNPNQEDKDKDKLGDACDNSDYYNPDQLDENKNGIGDISEDSDNDGIIGLNDNCINISNRIQLDSDNDGIGDLCEDSDNDNILFANDNCPYNYNKDQKDIDNDGIGDICDEKDERFIESNMTFFIGLLIFISLIFGYGIYTMVKKLK